MSVLPNDLTAQVTGDVGDMYPTAVALPDELREAYLPLLLHLLDEFEQPAVISLVPRNDICCAAQHMVTILCSTHKCIKLLAAVA